MIAANEPTTPDDVEIPTADGLRLRGWHWDRPSPSGALVIVHGLGEHAGVYRSVAEAIGETLGLAILAIDCRGHGRSPGKRGLVYHYGELLNDVEAGLDWARQQHPSAPRFVLGHSNGGLATILALLRTTTMADGLILSNPALRVRYPAPRHKVAIGRVLRVAAPWVTLGEALPVAKLTGDPLQQTSLRHDTLMHSRISARLYFGMLDGGREALRRAGSLSLPMLMILGGDDPIIDPEAGRDFFRGYGSPDRALIDVPGLLHVPLLERGRGAIYEAIVDWLRPRLERDRRGA